MSLSNMPMVCAHPSCSTQLDQKPDITQQLVAGAVALHLQNYQLSEQRNYTETVKVYLVCTSNISTSFCQLHFTKTPLFYPLHLANYNILSIYLLPKKSEIT